MLRREVKKIVFLISAGVLFANISFAATNASTPFTMVSQFYMMALGISGVLAMLMIVWGAIQYIVSAGNSSKLSEARDIILNAIYGLLLLLGAYLLLNSINPQILKSSPLINPTLQVNKYNAPEYNHTGDCPAGCRTSGGYYCMPENNGKPAGGGVCQEYISHTKDCQPGYKVPGMNGKNYRNCPQ